MKTKKAIIPLRQRAYLPPRPGLKRGDKRTDGYIFMRYRKEGEKTYECWVSPLAFKANFGGKK